MDRLDDPQRRALGRRSQLQRYADGGPAHDQYPSLWKTLSGFLSVGSPGMSTFGDPGLT
jgi:hypothetical protein